MIKPDEKFAGSIADASAAELDLTCEMIDSLRELRRPGRMIDAMVQEGEIYQMKRVEAPLHPLIIEDIPQP